MSLMPSATVTLGNLRYDVQISHVIADFGILPAVNTVRISLPPNVEVSAAAGDPASLELEGGEGAETMMTGVVHAFSKGLMTTEVQVVDASAKLNRLRPNATYERQSAQNVVRALAGAAGVSIGTLRLDLPLAAYVAHQRRTAAEHIADLARLGGAIASISSDGALNLLPQGNDLPTMALRYGRELLHYEVREQPGPASQPVRIGQGPAGSADAPDALRPTLEALPGNAPVAGPDAVRQSVAILRTPNTAQTASQAAAIATAAQAQRVFATCFLVPQLRPGIVLEIQDLPHNLGSGPWLLTRVVHRLNPQTGGSTTWEGISARGSNLLGSQLGALTGIGSLL